MPTPTLIVSLVLTTGAALNQLVWVLRGIRHNRRGTCPAPATRRPCKVWHPTLSGLAMESSVGVVCGVLSLVAAGDLAGWWA